MNIKLLIGLLGVLVAAMAAEFNDQVASIALVDVRGASASATTPALGSPASIFRQRSSGWRSPHGPRLPFMRRFMLSVIGLNCASILLIPFASDLTPLGLAPLYGLRLLQGLAGGMSIPLLMSMALRALPPPIRLYGLGVYALTTTFTPALATTMAALWTEVVGWQFVLFEAIPLCAAAAVLVWYGVPQDPLQLGRFRKADWRGALLVVIGCGSLSTMLPRIPLAKH